MGAILRIAAELPATDLGNQTAETQISNGDGTILLCNIPKEPMYDTIPLRALAWGYATSGAANTFTITFYYGSSTTISSNSVMASRSFDIVADERRAWMLDDLLAWADESIDTTQAVAAGFLTADATVANTQNLLPTQFEQLSMTASFATSDASNALVVNGFQIMEAF
jgi:hypothetical protein